MSKPHYDMAGGRMSSPSVRSEEATSYLLPDRKEIDIACFQFERMQLCLLEQKQAKSGRLLPDWKDATLPPYRMEGSKNFIIDCHLL